MGVQEAQSQIFELLKYSPTNEQWAVHRDSSRFKQPVGGVRGGKSMVGEKELVSHWYTDFLAKGKKDGLVWLLGNDYEACRGEWQYLVQDFTNLEVLAKPPTKNIDPGEIKLQDGFTIVTKSAKYPEKIATTAPDMVIICEAGQVDYEVLLRCIERLSEKRGYLIASGTFEEEDYVGWFR
jgi:hypothetical protein